MDDPPKDEDVHYDTTACEENAAAVVGPLEALKCLQEHATGTTTTTTLLVDTHNHAHLRRERHETYIDTDATATCSHDDPNNNNNDAPLSIVSLTLAVEPEDWDDAIEFSANGTTRTPTSTNSDNNNSLPTLFTSDRTLMGLGTHPWYISDRIVQDTDKKWIQRLESILQQHPSAVIGEIGLCKMAKCARQHPQGKARGFEFQREVLQEQWQLATRYRRPVSVHCVQQHGVFLDVLNEISDLARSAEPDTTKSPLCFVPPAIGMHSFTGTAHHVKALLQWEATLFGEGPNDSKKKKKKKKNRNGHREESSRNEHTDNINEQPTPRPPLLYFGFSHIINYEMCTSEKAKRQGRDAIRAVPLDRIMVESDVHHPRDVAAGTAGAVAYLAWALELSIPQVADITARNGLRFLQSHLSSAVDNGAAKQVCSNLP